MVSLIGVQRGPLMKFPDKLVMTMLLNNEQNCDIAQHEFWEKPGFKVIMIKCSTRSTNPKFIRQITYEIYNGFMVHFCVEEVDYSGPQIERQQKE